MGTRPSTLHCRTPVLRGASLVHARPPVNASGKGSRKASINHASWHDRDASGHRLFGFTTWTAQQALLRVQLAGHFAAALFATHTFGHRQYTQCAVCSSHRLDWQQCDVVGQCFAVMMTYVGCPAELLLEMATSSKLPQQIMVSLSMIQKATLLSLRMTQQGVSLSLSCSL